MHLATEFVVLEGRVAGGFAVRDLPGRSVPYRDTVTFTVEEYEGSKALKEAVLNGWLVLSKNTRRKLNLTFSKKSQLPQQQSLPPTGVPSTFDRDSIKAELAAELLPQMVQALAEALRGNQAALVKTLVDSNEKNAQLLHQALSSGVQIAQKSAKSEVRDAPDEMFIPDTIRSDDLKGSLAFEKTESSVDDVSNALKALKKGKKK